MSRFQHLQPKLRPLLRLLWLPLSLLWLECVVHVHAFHSLFDRGLIFIILFSLSIGLFLEFVCCFFRTKGCSRTSLILLLFCTIWHMVQTVYYTVFTTFLTLYSVGTGAGKITQYWRETLAGIADAAPALLLEFIPILLMLWKCRKCFFPSRSRKPLFCVAGIGMVVFHLIAVLTIGLSTSGLMSPHYLYRDTFVPELSVSNFGVMTTLRLDAQNLLFDQPDESPETVTPDENPVSTPEPEATTTPTPGPTTTPEAEPSPSPSPEPIVWANNVMDIDFASLAAGTDHADLKALHQYFAGREPTAQNEYTGMFEGKNLIFITAEAFSSLAVHPELTPTLYRLSHNGFVFENFYNPLWWVSTSDGEYVNCQSLIPKSGVWSMYRSGSNTLPFTLGNQFRRLDYNTFAYHNHTYDYYSRDVSHPNMGYDYKGKGNGLDVTGYWPESDLEMMELSVPEYLDQTPFHIYYMTVSGHMNYTFLGNSMSSRHRDKVNHLELSEECRAYLACNIELDLALEYLLNQLEQKGILEDTVICLSGDHYPYGLDKKFIDELAGHEVEESFELYKSTLILWSGDMQTPVTVSKPCSSLDILPTLSNLFGLEYDSRLMMGRDILSDSEGLVVLSDHSFITEQGRYNARKDEFIPHEDTQPSPDYARSIMKQVNDMFRYSVKVLENDYYSTLDLFSEE